MMLFLFILKTMPEQFIKIKPCESIRKICAPLFSPNKRWLFARNISVYRYFLLRRERGRTRAALAKTPRHIFRRGAIFHRVVEKKKKSRSEKNVPLKQKSRKVYLEYSLCVFVPFFYSRRAARDLPQEVANSCR